MSASIPASPASCVHSGGTVTCALGDLAPGDDVTVFIDVTVDPSVPDGTTITNDASVSSASPDSDLSNNSVSEDTLVEASADLWIDKTGNKLTGNPSGTVEYRITVHNNEGCSMDDPEVCGTGGPSDAVDVVVVDPLPLDPKKFRVEYLSESCAYDETAHTVTCTTPLLIAGDEVVHIIQADVKGKAEVVTNTATVSSATADTDAGNNTDTFLISIKGGKGNGGGPK